MAVLIEAGANGARSIIIAERQGIEDDISVNVESRSRSGMGDRDYMQLALEQARMAGAQGEVPVGAVLLSEGQIIARGANAPIASCDPTAHAEIVALRAGARALGNYRLPGSVLYVTLEPCLMCAAALMHSRVGRVVFGAWDAQFGAAGGLIDAFRLPGLNHRLDVFGGVMAEECGALLREFFAKHR
jgi:tRNA(adenine34) deaminase